MNKVVNEAVTKLKKNNIDETLALYLYKYLDDKNLYKQKIQELIEGIPVQYLVGHIDFLGNKIIVNKNVLIPRFETEELVYKTINYIKQYYKQKIKIVDLGTGSGCIAISLKKSINSTVYATDISKNALSIAKENAKLNNVEINFYEGDFLKPLNGKYDVIISNPPYISYDEEIMNIVKNNEPHIALYADNNGLECYEKILSTIKKYLNPKYLIALEIGYKQANGIKEIIKKYLKNTKIIIEKDMRNKERFIFITNIE